MKNLVMMALVSAGMMLTSFARGATHGKHLFVLSGQSNMAGLNPDISFTPTVEATFGKEKVSVVKDAQSGQPIRRWVKGWKSANELIARNTK